MLMALFFGAGIFGLQILLKISFIIMEQEHFSFKIGTLVQFEPIKEQEMGNGKNPLECTTSGEERTRLSLDFIQLVIKK